MIAKSQRWQLTAIAAAALMGLWGTHANALSLGRVNVQSSLGEPLKAEIEILDINAEEAATLSAKVASPGAFKAAGLDYNAAMTSLQATLQRRANGRAYLKLSSDRPINDPFVDMILEASWNTGRIVRDYTMLFDPPSLRNTATAPITPSQAPAAVPGRAETQTVPRNPEVKSPRPPGPATVAKPPPAARPQAQQSESSTRQLTVKAGDTAGRIAATNKPASVSLDQMLVALLRTNPDAFIGDNVNRLKAGALVTVPDEAQALATTPTQASQIIIAQSQDFNDFRRKLASNAPSTQVVPTSRSVSGKLEASVDDKKPSAATPDKLTLSKGAILGKASEDQLAQARNAKEAADRATELAKNLQDLSKLAAASSAGAATATAASASEAKPKQAALPGLPPPQVALPAASTPIPVTAPAASSTVAAASAVAAIAPASAAPPVSAASAQALPASKPGTPLVQPVAEPSLVDTLLEDPLAPAGALGLIALLAGFGFYKVQQRKKAATQDSAFDESRIQPESFFGNSGGQNVDTNDSAVTGSSMIYSPSQLDAVDDVDPVAEADVYLAYGRDLQAEEILKDALRTNPERLTIHQKLLEIYAKRRDAKAFEAIATLAFNLTDGMGADWEQICEKGLALDSDNALYLPGGQPLSELTATTRPAGMDSIRQNLENDQTGPAANPMTPSTGNTDLDLDLDLDFSLDEPDLPDSEFNAHDLGTETLPAPLAMTPDATLDTPWSTEDNALEQVADEAKTTRPSPLAAEDDDPFGKTQVLTAAPTADKPVSDSGMMEFDLGSLSLDFAITKPGELTDLGDAPGNLKPGSSEEPETQAGAFPETAGDPLETKLALADEFKAIGDDDGARALIEEVIAEATGEMKAKAQRALSSL